jgi:hypothetical protein
MLSHISTALRGVSSGLAEPLYLLVYKRLTLSSMFNARKQSSYPSLHGLLFLSGWLSKHIPINHLEDAIPFCPIPAQTLWSPVDQNVKDPAFTANLPRPSYKLLRSHTTTCPLTGCQPGIRITEVNLVQCKTLPFCDDDSIILSNDIASEVQSPR